MSDSSLLLAIIKEAQDDLLDPGPTFKLDRAIKDILTDTGYREYFTKRRRQWKQDQRTAHRFLFGQPSRLAWMAEQLDLTVASIRKATRRKLEAAA